MKNIFDRTSYARQRRAFFRQLFTSKLNLKLQIIHNNGNTKVIPVCPTITVLNFVESFKFKLNWCFHVCSVE